MKQIALFVTFILFGVLILQLRHKEEFSVQLKTDFGSFNGLGYIATSASTQVKKINDLVWGYVPFRPQLHKLERHIRRKFYRNKN